MPLPDEILPPPADAPDLDDDSDRDRWRIRDSRSAEWVMRKLSHATARRDALLDEREEYRAQLDAWWGDATRGLDRDIAWATAALQAWALDERERDPESKTQVLPSGRVSTREVGPRVEVVDPGEVASVLARAHVPQYEEIVRSTIHVDSRGLAALLRVADEWVVTLAPCGCQSHVWLLQGSKTEIAPGMKWPVRSEEHECGDPLPTALDVEAVERVSQDLLVLPVTEEGQLRIYEVHGATLHPPRISASVSTT